jgi:hypothetical protein
MVVFLEELENTLPSSARAISITLTPTSANITFACDDKFVAAGTLHLLRNLKTATDMQCKGVAQQEGEETITFSCTFTLKDTATRNPESTEDDMTVDEFYNSEASKGEDTEDADTTDAETSAVEEEEEAVEEAEDASEETGAAAGEETDASKAE